MRLEIPKKLIVRVFAVNVGLGLFVLLVCLMIPGDWRLDPLSDLSLIFHLILLPLLSGLAGLCCLLLPFSAGMLVTILPKRPTLCVLGALTVASLLAFGFWGIGFLFLIALWVGLMIPAVGRTLSSAILGFVVMGVWLSILLPKLGAANPATRARIDMSNVNEICKSVRTYHMAHSMFPDRLSQLQDVTNSLNMFKSPRGAGMIRPLQEGPLRRPSADEPPDPGPWRKITSWSEVDGGDYLYRKPPNDAPTSTIMVMTRPGLLYRNWINVGFVDGHVERMELKVWKNRPDVIEFLKQTGAAPP